MARAPVLELRVAASLDQLTSVAATMLERRSGTSADVLERGFSREVDAGFLPVAHGAALPHLRVPGLGEPVILLVRCHEGIRPNRGQPEPLREQLVGVRAAFFVVSPEEDPGRHLRLLGHLATHVADPDFLDRWMAARNEAELKETLLREDRWLTLRVGSPGGAASWGGRSVRSLALPTGALVALVRRNGRSIVPHGSTVLEDGDHLTVIGDPSALRGLTARRGAPAALLSG